MEQGSPLVQCAAAYISMQQSSMLVIQKGVKFDALVKLGVQKPWPLLDQHIYDK